MRNLVLLLLFCITLLSAEVNECKSDVYFGNGILTEKKDARTNAGILRDAIIEKFGLDYYKKHIGKVDYAYNRTDGEIIDLLESLVQKIEGTGIENLHKYIKRASLLARLMT